MHLITRTSTAALMVFALCGASCSPSNSSEGGGAPAAAADTTPRARVARLEADARALAKTSGCSTASQCRTAPVGATPCGGPRAYLAYCAATTDSAALFKKLDELKAAETKLNESAGMMGTCEFRMPPSVSATGGSCRAATGVP